MYTFGQIMNFDEKDNRRVFNELLNDIARVVPFAGAGLTAFAYPTWSGTLCSLAEAMDDRASEMEVRQLVSEWKYEASAQLINEKLSDETFRQRMGELFSKRKLEAKREVLNKQAISLLPKLFEGLAVTTNFDEGLEYVYNGFEYVFRPADCEAFVLSNRKHTRSLFKLHGTVMGNVIPDGEKIVFTTAQYDEAYAPDSPLVDKLRETFRDKIMLFLGCSLTVDRTMELLDQVRDITNQDWHYAIVSCKPGQQDSRRIELEAYHIHPIFYEDGKHEAVRVILEELLRQTKPDVYNALEHKVGALPKNLNRFSYKAGITSFIGRKAEMKELYDFINSSGDFKWWAIIGPGGAGKSRLAWEIHNRMPEGWQAHFITKDDYKDLNKMKQQYPQKMLFIADYVQRHAVTLGQWMESLNESPHSQEVRLLLVERDVGREDNAFAWTNQLYDQVDHKRELEAACYEDFMALRPPTDDEMLEIITDYGKNLHDSGSTETDIDSVSANIILEKLKTVDSDYTRPLYAMFLTDAYIEKGAEEMTQMSQENVLDYVIDREESRIKGGINETLGLKRTDNILFNACKYLWLAATVWQDTDYNSLKQTFPEQWDIVEKKAESVDTPEGFLRKIGLGEIDSIPSMKPDIMGEYLVLDWLIKNPRQSGEFIGAVLSRPIETVSFYERLMHDYKHILNGEPNIWFSLFPELNSKDDIAVFSYLLIIVNATYYCDDADVCKSLTVISRRCQEQFPDNQNIALRYAQSLSNLIGRQDSVAGVDTLKRLEVLFNGRFPEDLDIALTYASGLTNLIAKQDSAEGAVTLNKLEGLFNIRFSESRDIALAYVKGLTILIAKQDGAEGAATLDKLESVFISRFPENHEVANLVASGMIHLFIKHNNSNISVSLGNYIKLVEFIYEQMSKGVVFSDWVMGYFTLITHQPLSSD